MKLEFETRGTCARRIVIDIDEETQVVRGVEFVGGCAGNTQGVASLVRGMKASEVADRLEGIQCGAKGTSCPDQLAHALRQAMEDYQKRKA